MENSIEQKTLMSSDIGTHQSELRAVLRHYCHERSGHSGPLVVVGSSGSGRSLLLDWLRRELTREEPGSVILCPLPCPEDSSPQQYLREICVQLRHQYKLRARIGHELDSLIATFRRLLWEIPTSRPLFLITDDIDRLNLSLHDFLRCFPRGLTTAVRWMASIRSDSTAMLAALQLRRARLLELPPLSEIEVSRQLSAIESTSISPSVFENPWRDNFLYLSTMIASPALQADTTSRRREAGTADEALQSLFDDLLISWEATYGRQSVEAISALVLAHRRGINAQDLADTFESKAIQSDSPDLWQAVIPHGFFDAHDRWRPNYHLLAAMKRHSGDSLLIREIHEACAKASDSNAAPELRVEQIYHARQGDDAALTELLTTPNLLNQLWRDDPLEAIAAFRTIIEVEEGTRLLRDLVPAGVRGEVLARQFLAIGDSAAALEILKTEESKLRTEEQTLALVPNLSLQATLHEITGNMPAAAELLEDLTKTLQASGKLKYLLPTLRRRGKLALETGNPETARQIFQEHARLATEVEHADERLLVLAELTRLAVHFDDLDEADRLAAELEAGARQLSALDALANSLTTQAQLLLKRQDFEQAASVLREARQVVLVTGELTSEIQILGLSALVANQRGNHAQALELLEEKELRCRELADPRLVSECLISQAALLAGKLGRSEEALLRAEEAIALATPVNDAQLLQQASRLCTSIAEQFQSTAQHADALSAEPETPELSTQDISAPDPSIADFPE